MGEKVTELMDSLSLKSVISNMVDPETVKALSLNPANVNPDPNSPPFVPWSDLSLSSGYPSLLLFFSEVEKRGLVDNGDEIIHRYVLKIKEAIETQGLFELSMYGGVTGICFALSQASFGGKRYQRMLDSLHGFLFERIEPQYLEPLRENRRQSLPSSPGHYDPIQGICGIGRYALENLSSPKFLRLANDITKVLVDLSQPLRYEGLQIPGWYLSPEDHINARNRESCPKGNFNLGLAHGVTGILAFLAIASLRGINIEGQKEAIATIATWIRNKAFLSHNRLSWSYSVPWEEEVEGRVSSMGVARDAWCYGAPGVARTLFLAGQAIGDLGLKNFATAAFRDIFCRTRQEWGLPGPTLCHGIAGLLLITHEMAKEDGCEDLHVRVSELKETLLSFYHPDSPWGFKDVEPCRHGKSCELNKVGFLEGATGVLLTLISLSDAGTRWHLPLLIHD